MTDAQVDASITARRLLIQLLHAQHTTGQHEEAGEGSPGGANVDRPDATQPPLTGRNFPPPTCDLSQPPSRSPSLHLAQPSTHHLQQPSHNGATEGVASHQSSSAAQGIIFRRTDEADTQPASISRAQGKKSRRGTLHAWWQRRRRSEWSLPSDAANLRVSTTEANSHTMGWQQQQQQRGASMDLQRENVEEGVQRWRDDLYCALRRQGALFEERLSALLRTHVQATTTAVTPTLDATAIHIAAETPFTPGVSSPLPPIGSRVAPASVIAPAQLKTVDRHDGPAALTMPGLPLDLNAQLRLVSTGYAATVALETNREQLGPAVGEGRADCWGGQEELPRTCAAAQDMGHEPDRETSTVLQSDTKETKSQLFSQSGTRARRVPMTLREQLQECVVHKDESKLAGKHAPLTARDACFASEKIASLLSQLRQEQRTSLPAGEGAVNPLSRRGCSLPCPPPSDFLKGAPAVSSTRAAAQGTDDALTAAAFTFTPSECTVWECLPLQMTSSHEAALCAAEDEMRSDDAARHLSSQRGSPSSRAPLARLRAAWRRRIRGRKTGGGPAADTSGGGSVNGVHRRPFASSLPAARGAVLAGDPLCVMTDGEWNAVHASVRATQQFLQRLARTRTQLSAGGASAAAHLPSLTAYCPLKAHTTGVGARERVVMIYSCVPCELDGINWVTPTAQSSTVCSSEATRSLRLYSSWAVCVEVDAVHAAWLRRTLLQAATVPSPAAQKVASKNTSEAEALRELTAEITATIEALRQLSV